MAIKSRCLKIYIDSDFSHCTGCEHFEYAEFANDKAYCRIFGGLQYKNGWTRHDDCLKSECFDSNTIE